jgi:hypothetical protein
VKYEKLPKPRPSLMIDSDYLPEIEKWDVGKKYTLTLDVQMTEKSKGSEYEDEKEDCTHARLKVLSAVATSGKDISRSDKMKALEKKAKDYS